MMPLVSIIIPVYNKAAFIRETLDSALAQTYPNTEIILVDDGSSDGSLKILEKYAEDFPEKIRLIAQKNAGVSPATNKGIQMAKGEYIQFLDADDLLSPEKIELQMRLLEDKNKRTMCSCEWVTFLDDPERHQRWNLRIFKDYSNPVHMVMDLYHHGEMMQPGVFLCSKELILRAGLWDESLTINQDGEFFLRVMLQAKEVLFESSAKVFYRKPGVTNVSQQKSYRASQSLLESYRCYERELLKKENSERVREALAKNYMRFIYVTYPKYPDLIKEAEKEIKKFAFTKPVHIGGPKFQQISKWIGFKNAVRVKRWLG
ncbi:glycosyltransferase family 2 protein [Mariniradius sediminis]|uniref:Glycosyltransferase family 2 protein n=1 Tax=Mariniradius sediminis TaxID=2909237 RepID=A0ABS9BT34_9BACT|nr:glycosyltransferase family A protein [Mariniradius sediminis]MCF1750306.1 glycosyltransferase family 2 protein [Mariniradius sediminis]